MAPPQSETARRLFRALGRDPYTGAKLRRRALVAAVYVSGARGSNASDDANDDYEKYADAYANYLQAMDAVNGRQFKEG